MNTSKIILVTGGNRGIGLEICRQLAAAGHHVIMGSRDVGKGQAAAQGFAGKIEVRQLDVADEASINALAQSLATEVSHIDVLINNAGVISNGAGTSKVTLLEMQTVFATNSFGPLMLSQRLLPLLRKSRAARIINVSSQMGQWASLQGGYAAYRLSKTFLNAMTVLMANELRADGIQVNAMCPGWVKTDMGGPSASRSVQQGADTAVWLATAEQIPTGKFFSDRKAVAW